MKKILLALFLLGPPLQAQHRSSPGTPGGVAIPITVNGQCQVVTAGGTNSAMFAVTGTWTGTLGFFGTNDLGATTVALQAYPVTTSTGALGTSSVNTTTGNGVWIADTFGMYQAEICATAAMTGSALIRIDADPAVAVMQVTGIGGAAIAVTGSLSVSGAADVVSTGAPTTFNANTICTGALLTAGLQSAGFHLDAGTLAATLTAQCSAFTSGTTNFTTGGLKDVTGATVSGAVTNPNAQTDWTITCPGNTRRVQVCTTAFTGGAATGQAVGTFYQTASAAGGGGGGVVTQTTGTNLHTVTDATSVTTATQSGTWTVQPGNTANTTPWLLKIDQTTPGTTNGIVINQTANVQGLGTAGSPSGGVFTCQPPSSGGTVQPVSGTVTANMPDVSGALVALTAACSTGVSCGANTTALVQMAGTNTPTVTFSSGSSPVMTVVADCAMDGGVGYQLPASPSTSGLVAFLKSDSTYSNAITNPGNVSYRLILPPVCGGSTTVRVRAAAFTSGSVNGQLRSVLQSIDVPVEAKPTSQNTITLTASTAETTLLAAGGSGVFFDLTELSCTNTSTSSNVITVRDTTGGTMRRTIACPAAVGPCEGWVWKVPWRQTAAAANWTIQAGSSTSSVVCEIQGVQR